MGKLFDRIAIRLVMWVVLFSTVLTLVSTFGQLYYESDMFNDSLVGIQPYSTTFMADGNWMDQDISGRFSSLLVGNGLKIFLAAGFALVMFQYLVTRHLEALARQIHRLDFTKPSEPLQLKRQGREEHDELDQLIAGLNTIQERAGQAYESLACNEQRLLLFFDATEEAILGVDRQSVCSFANAAFLKMLGLKSEEVIGRGLHELFVHSAVSPALQTSEKCLVGQAMNEGRALHCENGFITVAGGSRIFSALRVYPVLQQGNVSGALIFIHDNSKQRQLLRERELLSEAIEHVPMMIMIADSDHALQYINGDFERMTGFSRQEMIGRPPCIFEDISEKGKEKRAAIETRLGAGKRWEGVLETQSKCGRTLKFFSVISPVFDEENRLVNTILVSREVSSEIALHKELVNAKKMEAVGRLSSSFAHEFGNPLFGIRSVLRDIVERVDLAEEDRSLLELAYGECERIRKMVREFQLLYRESTAVDEVQSVNKILIGVLESIGPLMSVHKVTYTLNLIDETNEVVANGAKLSLVLGKIMVNAIEAMSSTGGVLQIGSFLQEEYLVISIGDAGGGIKQEHQELVFEPFFSTKPVVEGAGLGLSVAYGTMKSLGGTIMFTSEEGRGSVFTIHLPLG